MKTLKLFFSLIVFPLLFLKANAQIVYDANAQVRNIGSFSAVHIGGSMDLYITSGNEEVVAVSGRDAAVIADISTEVKNGTLYIGMKQGHKFGSNENVKAYISVKTLNKLEASGASDIYVNGKLQTTDLLIKISGASDFKGEVQVQNLRLQASGSSDFSISGRTVNLNIDLSGSSDVKGFDLSADNCDITASGASDVRITVNKEIKANLNGSSDVAYRGAAAIREIKASGASSVKQDRTAN